MERTLTNFTGASAITADTDSGWLQVQNTKDITAKGLILISWKENSSSTKDATIEIFTTSDPTFDATGKSLATAIVCDSVASEKGEGSISIDEPIKWVKAVYTENAATTIKMKIVVYMADR